MEMTDLIFGYIAGLLTLINPCVLPVLPLVLGAAVQSNRHGPLALALGMGVSFVSLGLFIALAGRAVGLTETMLAQAGAAMMVAFGLILIVPQFSRSFERATAGFAAEADTRLDDVDQSGLKGQFFWGRPVGGRLVAMRRANAWWRDFAGFTG